MDEMRERRGKPCEFLWVWDERELREEKLEKRAKRQDIKRRRN